MAGAARECAGFATSATEDGAVLDVEGTAGVKARTGEGGGARQDRARGKRRLGVEGERDARRSGAEAEWAREGDWLGGELSGGERWLRVGR